MAGICSSYSRGPNVGHRGKSCGDKEAGTVRKGVDCQAQSEQLSGPDLHVIIVYAPDWRDVAQVRRILKSLREAGIARGWVHFKRDRETYAGAYVVRGRQGVSVWNARPGDTDEISTKWVTGNPILVTDASAADIVAAIEMIDAGQS